MPEYFALPREDQREALLVAPERSGRRMHLLEKDMWAVWALRRLFTGPHAQHLVFKGGPSLSKAYGVIKRFLVDVDLAYDIRAIAPTLIEKADSRWRTSRSQEKKWGKAIRQRLAELVSAKLAPDLAKTLAGQALPAKDRAEDEKVFIDLSGPRCFWSSARDRLASPTNCDRSPAHWIWHPAATRGRRWQGLPAHG